MMGSLEHKIAYNRKTQEEWGWRPEWFFPWAGRGSPASLGSWMILNQAVLDFQKRFGLAPDGLVGPMTFQRIWTYREAHLDELDPVPSGQPTVGSELVHGTEFHHIDWPAVIHPADERGKQLPRRCYSPRYKPRDTSMGVVHWDVCLSSDSCFRALAARGASVHFGIDNDGTIHQWLDTHHVGFHASDGDVNKISVGVEVTNAYYPGYQDWYGHHGFGPRPIIEDAEVHGVALPRHLGFYDVQLRALKALLEYWNRVLGIPLKSPEKNATVDEVQDGSYRGVVHHYQVTREKIDCAGLDLNALME